MCSSFRENSAKCTVSVILSTMPSCPYLSFYAFLFYKNLAKDLWVYGSVSAVILLQRPETQQKNLWKFVITTTVLLLPFCWRPPLPELWGLPLPAPVRTHQHSSAASSFTKFPRLTILSHSSNRTHHLSWDWSPLRSYTLHTHRVRPDFPTGSSLGFPYKSLRHPSPSNINHGAITKQ